MPSDSASTSTRSRAETMKPGYISDSIEAEERRNRRLDVYSLRYVPSMTNIYGHHHDYAIWLRPGIHFHGKRWESSPLYTASSPSSWRLPSRTVSRAVLMGWGTRVSKIGKFCNILQIFGGLVLGCINTNFCKSVCV